MNKTYPRALYKIEPCIRSDIKNFVEEYHYSKSINGIKIDNCFRVVTIDGALVGAVIFGGMSTTSWKKYGSLESDVVELRRLVLLDECVKNTESFVIGKCLKYLKKYTAFKTVISYADPHYQHSGVIYKASNFKYLGTTSQDILIKDTVSNKVYHSRALRTKYKDNFKPFALRLQKLDKEGLIERIKVPGKHIYKYKLRD